MQEFSLADYQAARPWGGIEPALMEKMKREGFHSHGKLNIYTCKECRGHIVTRDVDHGVTPFMTPCQATGGCKGLMQSSMYRVFDQKMRPSHVWYRPGPDAEFAGGTRDHLEKGGLILRAATSDEELA